MLCHRADIYHISSSLFIGCKLFAVTEQLMALQER
jgi:hypothetical protein